MQVLSNPNQEADKQRGVYCSYTHGLGELPAHDVNLVGHDYWRNAEPVWQVASFPVDHQPPGQFGYLREQQRPLTGSTSSNDFHQATSFPIPSDDWPPNVTLDTASDEYGNTADSPISVLYPSVPQGDFVISTDVSEPKRELEGNDAYSIPMSPTGFEEGPESQKKRNRNRLAAAKCREKAKRGVDDLQQREKDLVRENKMLHAEAGVLREEVLRLKSEILRHSNCDNDYIHHYIQRAAKQVGAHSEDSDYGPTYLPAAG